MSTENTNEAAPIESSAPAEEAVTTTENVGQEDGSLLNGNEAASSFNDRPFAYVPDTFLAEDGTPDVEKLAKSYTELRKKMDGRIAPESVEEYDYEFNDPDLWNADMYSGFKDKAIEMGLSKENFGALMADYESTVMGIVESFSPTREKAEQALTEVWGDDFEDMLSSARTAWSSFADEGLDMADIGNNPTALRLLAAIGSRMGEDRVQPAQTTTGSSLSQTEVTDLMNRPDYFTNKEIQARVAAFYKANS